MEIAKLLESTAFKRENFQSFFFAPYSRKLRRRVYLYTENNFILWVRIESDPEISAFNERVQQVPVATPTGEVAFLKPRAVSVDQEGAVTIHTFLGLDLNCESNSGADLPQSICTTWANKYGYKCKTWTAESLHENITEVTNLKRLLRFVSNPNYFPDISLQDALLAELSTLRKITISSIVKRFPRSDEEDVVREICNLLASRRIYSDIGYRPFDLLTELSVHGKVSEM